MGLIVFVLEDFGEVVLETVGDLETVNKGDTVAIEAVGKVEPVRETVPLTDEVAHRDDVNEKTGLNVQSEVFDALDEMDAEPEVLKLVVVAGEDVADPRPTRGEKLATPKVAEGIDVTDCKIKLDVIIAETVDLPIEFVADVLIEILGIGDTVFEE